MTNTSPKQEIKKVLVSISVDDKTGKVSLKVDGPNKKIEKNVGEALIGLFQESAKVLNQKVKVIKQGYSNHANQD